MNIIFHHPLPIDPTSATASGIRPQRMLEAFRSAGCVVDVVAGNSRERKLAIKNIKNKISEGLKYEFLYSESSTLPTLLTDSNRLPINPNVDFGLFKICKYNNIPIGLFYRDIYWVFPNFKKKYNWLKFKIAEYFFRYDLKQYENLVDKIYLPSMKMADHIPLVSKIKFDTLPPGHTEAYDNRSPIVEGIHLLYVGGMSSHYELHEIFNAVKETPEVTFTLCTRKIDWQNVREFYPIQLPKNIRIVHESGSGLDALYEKANISLIFVRPHEYWDFAVPFKLFEYIGKNKPIIATAGTMAGNFIEEHDLGWTIPYDSADLVMLLQSLLDNPRLIVSKSAQLSLLAPNHTWKARAQKVIADLTEKPLMHVSSAI